MLHMNCIVTYIILSQVQVVDIFRSVCIQLKISQIFWVDSSLLHPCYPPGTPIVSGWVCVRALLLAFPSIFKDLAPPSHLVGFHRNHLVWLLSRKYCRPIGYISTSWYLIPKEILPSHNLVLFTKRMLVVVNIWPIKYYSIAQLHSLDRSGEGGGLLSWPEIVQHRQFTPAGLGLSWMVARR